MRGNGNRDVGINGNRNEVLDWEWEWDGNGNDCMGMGGNGNNNSHFRTSLVVNRQTAGQTDKHLVLHNLLYGGKYEWNITHNIMASSHRRQRQDKTVWLTFLSSLVCGAKAFDIWHLRTSLDPVFKYDVTIGNHVANWKLGQDKTRLSSHCISRLDKTVQKF